MNVENRVGNVDKTKRIFHKNLWKIKSDRKGLFFGDFPVRFSVSDFV